MARRRLEIQRTAIDRAIEWAAPQWGARRYRARAALALAGGYSGASTSRRSLAGWTTTAGDPDSDILPDLPTLRERSRDQLRNNPIAAGAINTKVTNVVGTGLKLQARVDADFLGMSEDQADDWEMSVEREFRLWAESPNCDAERSLTFTGLQELAFRSTLENGDVLSLLPSIERAGTPYQLAVQMVEADRICNKDWASDSPTLAGGVAKDQYGAPLAYHILNGHPGTRYAADRTWTIVPAYGETTGRRNALHLFHKRRPGQSRGVPDLAPVMEALKQLGTYTQAEIDAAVVAGLFTVFIKAEGDFELNPSTGMGAETGAKKGDDDVKLASGAMVDLAPGESIETANPGRPNTAFDPFVMSVLRQIGVGLEIPFELLVKHFTASYSAAQAAMLEAWKFFLGRRTWLAANFCQPIYQEWLYEAVALGRIRAPGFLNGDPAVRKAYCGAEWVGPARGQIDQLKEVKAARERIDAGISTISETTKEMTGGDWERNHRQSAKEARRRREDGLATEQPASAGFLLPDEGENTDD